MEHGMRGSPFEAPTPPGGVASRFYTPGGWLAAQLLRRNLGDVADAPVSVRGAPVLAVAAVARPQLHVEAQKGLLKFMPCVNAKTSHGYLLTTKVSGAKMDRRDLLLMLRRITEDRLGKRLGVQMIRVLRPTDSAEAINEAAKLRQELGHGAATQFQYVSR